MKIVVKVVLTVLSLLGIVASAITCYIGYLAGHVGVALSIVGNSSGPTSVFIAGKIGGNPCAIYIITACLMAVTIFFYVKTKKHKM